MKRVLPVLLLAACAVACGKDSNPAPAPSTPTTTTTTAPPQPTTFSLSGRITQAGGSGPIPGAIIRVLDGPNARKSAGTDGSGNYNLINLTSSGFTVSIVATDFAVTTRPVNLVGNVTLNAALLPAALFAKGGTGDTVFDVPAYVTRIRIQADYGGSSSNFIVKIGGRLLVNELVGRFWNQTHFDGTYVTAGGVTEITNSSGVSWSFVEQR